MIADQSLQALGEIEGLIRNPPETSRIVDIDPKTAKILLDQRNRGNRPQKPNKVQQFTADISSSRWGLTGDTIKFGSDGRLLDGQNRLAACVRADRNFKTHVVFNIDPALFGRMDIGKPRNAADVLHIAGYKYASTLASAVRWAYLLDTNPYNRDTLGPDFILGLVKNKYPDIEPFLSRGRSINKQYAHPAGQASALLYKFSKSDTGKYSEFYDAWMTGKRNGPYQIIDTMQALLHSQKVNNNGRIHELVRASVIIKAWNIFRLGQKGSLAQLQAAMNSPIEKIG
ncbi:hypothetical protein [Mesorhizobium sp. WSM4904]|uniref:hypothetical protein n=1 Tax=Mesorhizobium sp. WSM4904 TaxID=3038545 RepID=UPI002418B8DE|nr:hypothetical protein [Mesorhizobium sp. WSM4904]WFP65478.1 hypothetical protein QAZ47_13490 [Mesorhizobium sp. WSM4904]